MREVIVFSDIDFLIVEGRIGCGVKGGIGGYIWFGKINGEACKLVL